MPKQSIPLTLNGLKALVEHIFENGKEEELLPLLNCYGFLVAGAYPKSLVRAMPINDKLKRKFHADLKLITDMIFLMRYHADPRKGVEALKTGKFSFATSDMPKKDDMKEWKKKVAADKKRIRVLAAVRTIFIYWT